MRVKRLLETLQNADPEALVVVEYPEHRCRSAHGRLPGLAIVDNVDVLFDVQHCVGGGYIGSDTPETDIFTEDEVRLSVKRDEYS